MRLKDKLCQNEQRHEQKTLEKCQGKKIKHEKKRRDQMSKMKRVGKEIRQKCENEKNKGVRQMRNKMRKEKKIHEKKMRRELKR